MKTKRKGTPKSRKEKTAKKPDQTEIYPRIGLLGSTGSGKSSLVNALLEVDYQRVGVTPTTMKTEQIRWATQKATVYLLDTAGIGEAGQHQKRLDRMFDTLAEAHVALWVVGYPNRALDEDMQILRQIHNVEPDLPVFIIGTGIDRAASRTFDPDAFSTTNPRTQAEKKVNEWQQYLSKQLIQVGAIDVILCAAGEHANDSSQQFNLRAVHDAVEDVLPDKAKLDFIRRSRVLGPKDTKAPSVCGRRGSRPSRAPFSSIRKVHPIFFK